MPPTLRQFAERLTSCGLFTAAELAEFEAGLPPDRRPRLPQDLASGMGEVLTARHPIRQG